MASWFRVPAWCGAAVNDEHGGVRARAYVYLLGAWHLGDDPGPREVARRIGCGASRTANLTAEIAEWARDAGAKLPERLQNGTSPLPERSEAEPTPAIGDPQNGTSPLPERLQNDSRARAPFLRSEEEDQIRSDQRETEKAPPAPAGCSPTPEPEPMPQATPEPKGPPMPAWVPDAKASAPHDRRDVAAMVVRCVEAVRQTVINPYRCGTDSGPLLALWRKAGRPSPEAFAAEFRAVAEWAALSRDPGAARDIRAEGWEGGKDRSRDIATLARQDRWGDRSTAAQAWEAAGRAEARPVPVAAAPPPLTPSQARQRATRDALKLALNNLTNQTTPEAVRALS